MIKNINSMKKCLLILLAFSTCQLIAQTTTPDGGIYNSGAKIVIGSGAYLYIDGNENGDYIVTGSGSIDNDGTLIIEGDYINNSSGDGTDNEDADGIVSFRGTTTGMIIDGSAGSTSFDAVEFMRDANGDGTGVSLTTVLGMDVSVFDELTLTSGVVETGSNVLIMTSTVASDLTDYDTDDFIFGNFRRYINNGGSNTDTYVFPIGEGAATTNYHRADIINNNLTGGGFTYLTASVADNTKSGDQEDEDLPANLMWDNTRLFRVDGDAGTDYHEWSIIPDNEPAGGTYGIDLYFNNFTDMQDNEFTVIKRTEASTSFADWSTFEGSTTIPDADEAGRTAAGGFARKSGFQDFSKFAIASAGVVLPVELVSFESDCKNNTLHINWATASEINNDYYTLEKSFNGSEFFEVGKVFPESANSNSFKNYEYIVYSGNAYFRLKQTDIDGTVAYSDVIFAESCEGTETEDFIHAYTGNNEDIIIQIRSHKASDFMINVMDAGGREIIPMQKYAVVDGNNVFEIPTLSLATGVYVINVRNQTESYSQKVFIQ